MEYKVIGNTVPVVEMTLNAGETVYTQSGGMAYQSAGIDMKTNARGGIMNSLGRMFTGESIFMANYTATVNGAMIAFASTVPGSIVPFDLGAVSNGLLIQKGAFLCAESSVNTKVAFTKKVSAGFFGGEGLFLTKITGPGKVILQSQNFSDFAGRIIPYIPSNRR